MSRESKYLIRKIEAFDTAFKFFSKCSSGMGVEEKMMIFLCNMNFWDWEIENIIYSVVNFEDRSEAFENFSSLIEGVMKSGFLLKQSKVEDVKLDRRWKNHSSCRSKSTSQMVAPVDQLNQLIDDWNDFLSRIEKKLMSKTAKSFENWGENMKADLSSFKKEKLEKKGVENGEER